MNVTKNTFAIHNIVNQFEVLNQTVLPLIIWHKDNYHQVT